MSRSRGNTGGYHIINQVELFGIRCGSYKVRALFIVHPELNASNQKKYPGLMNPLDA